MLIDLKTTQISHQDVGQMDMYVRMYDELKRTDGDNPTIGLILCTETSRDIARYSVLHENPQLFAAKYLTYLPKEEELREEIERQKEIYSLQQIECNSWQRVMPDFDLAELYQNVGEKQTRAARKGEGRRIGHSP